MAQAARIRSTEKATADQVMFSDEKRWRKFRRLIVDHALLSDRAGTADRSDLSEDTRKFMGHPIEDFYCVMNYMQLLLKLMIITIGKTV